MKKTLLLLVVICCTVNLWGQKTITPVGAPFQNGQNLVFDYAGGTGAATDWIGIYPPNEIPDGDPASLVWKYITTPSGQVTFPGTLPNGTYKVYLFCCDGYTVIASAEFSVQGAPPASVSSNTFAKVDSSVTFKYSGGTGSPKDWIGIYKPGDVPGTDLSIDYLYVPTAEGSITFNNPKLPAGDYVAKLFCCDSYTVLASYNFTVYQNLAPSIAPVGALVADKPFTFRFTGGTGAQTDWIGIYPHGEVPDGDPASITYLYVNGANGELTFSPAGLKAGTFYDAHLFCCDEYKILASYTNFSFSTVAAHEASDAVPTLFTATPSPAKEVVNLNFTESVTGQFTFYNLTGQAIRSISVEGITHLAVRDLPSGTYIGQFRGNKGTQARKILVE